MIEAVVGNPGAGKSIYAVGRAMRAIAGGRTVYSNLYPRWPNTWRWGNWDCMREAGEGLYIVDEAQVWFGSRSFANNTSELHSWQQSRKRGADLIWIAQHEARVDVAIRELTSIIWRPRIIGPVLVATGQTMEGQRMGVDFFFHRKFYGAYHTDQVIGGRSDSFAVLARVNNPTYLNPPLYASAPSHCLVENGASVRLVPWFEGMTAHAYFYVDYSGTSWLLDLDANGWRIDRAVSSPEAAWVRELRRAYAKRGLQGVASAVGAAARDEPLTPGL